MTFTNEKRVDGKDDRTARRAPRARVSDRWNRARARFRERTYRGAHARMTRAAQSLVT